MIKTKECKIIYKQCEECGEIKFYKKFKNQKGKNGKLYIGKICNSCDNKKRKMQLNHPERKLELNNEEEDEVNIGNSGIKEGKEN